LVWAQHTVSAGSRCWRGDLGDDAVLYQGDDVWLLDHARALMDGARNAGAGEDLYMLRSARTLYDELGIAHDWQAMTDSAIWDEISDVMAWDIEAAIPSDRKAAMVAEVRACEPDQMPEFPEFDM